MIDSRFVIISVLLTVWGSLDYLVATLKGRVKPNRVTWFLWSLAPLVAFGGQLSEGVGWPSLMTFAVGFCPLAIFIASFIAKEAKWHLSAFDYVCGGLSLLGLLGWVITKDGIVAITFALIADILAGIPTLVKAWKAPETESYFVYLLTVAAAAITLLTLEQWTFAHYSFSMSVMLVGLALTVLIKFRIGKRFSVTTV